MPAVRVRNVDLEADLTGLVSLNCSRISTWRHYDKEARPGAHARWEDLSRRERWQHGGPWLDPTLLAFHLQVIKESGGLFLIAKEGETLVGELELFFDTEDSEGGRAHVARMVVNPASRREDAGKLLLQYGRRAARSRGCRRITVCAEDQMDLAFYESQGFRAASRVAEFVKPLTDSSKQVNKGALQAIRLSWDNRPQPPSGFRMVIGDHQSPRYIWTGLRQMNTLLTLLDVQAPAPNPWLLRLDEAEAIAVDYERVELWSSPQGLESPDFLRIALERTELLSKSNAVARLTAVAFEPQFSLLRDEGYALQREYPWLALSL